MVRVEGKPQIKCNQREGISYSEIVGAAGVGFCFDAGSVFDSGPGHVWLRISAANKGTNFHLFAPPWFQLWNALGVQVRRRRSTFLTLLHVFHFLLPFFLAATFSCRSKISPVCSHLFWSTVPPPFRWEKVGHGWLNPIQIPKTKLKIRFCTSKTRTAKSKRQEVNKCRTKNVCKKMQTVPKKTSIFIIFMLFEITGFHFFSTEKGEIAFATVWCRCLSHNPIWFGYPAFDKIWLSHRGQTTTENASISRPSYPPRGVKNVTYIFGVPLCRVSGPGL